MKNTLLLILITGLYASCDKNCDCIDDQDTFRVKVINHICADAVLQILDEDYYHLAQDEFVAGEEVLTHVFFTSFRCSDLDGFQTLSDPITIGKIFTVKLGSSDLGDCAVCEATVAYRPEVVQYIDVLQ